MGLTERHWFEDEEPELTEHQLEDIARMKQEAYQEGYEDRDRELRGLPKLAEERRMIMEQWQKVSPYPPNVPDRACIDRRFENAHDAFVTTDGANQLIQEFMAQQIQAYHANLFGSQN